MFQALCWVRENYKTLPITLPKSSGMTDRIAKELLEIPTDLRMQAHRENKS